MKAKRKAHEHCWHTPYDKRLAGTLQCCHCPEGLILSTLDNELGIKPANTDAHAPARGES